MNSFVNQPFKIGTLELPNRCIQAPLAGISCAPFRSLFSLYTKPAYAVTEMISAQSILQHQRLNPRYLERSSQEGRWCIQLSGHDAKVLYEATQIASGYLPDLIDLNCGCPKPKIRGKGCGSALMDSPLELADVVSAMRQATDLPLTVKIRVAGSTSDNRYLEAARIIEQSGADAIIVHGRHYSEGYDVCANYEQIRKIKSLVTIPVIANGDVSDRQSMLDCLEKTNADAVMVARGSIGKPWLFKQLLGDDVEPLMDEVINVFAQHIEQLSLLEGCARTALHQARRLLKWYFPSLSENQLSACYKLECLDSLTTYLRGC